MQDGKLASRRSFVTADMVKEVKNGLTDTELGESDERMINQFLRATKMDVQQAVKRLKATIAWRLKEQPHRRICTMCAKTSGSHYLQVVISQHKGTSCCPSCACLSSHDFHVSALFKVVILF